MIKATIREDGFRIEGHANYAPRGYDIVCAGVSSLVGTVCDMSSETMQEFEVDVEKGLISITYLDIQPTDIQLLEFLKVGLIRIQNQHPAHLEVAYEH